MDRASPRGSINWVLVSSQFVQLFIQSCSRSPIGKMSGKPQIPGLDLVQGDVSDDDHLDIPMPLSPQGTSHPSSQSEGTRPAPSTSHPLTGLY